MSIAENVSRKPLKGILLHNFLGGVAWGLGVTVGATVILALGGFLLSKINYIPLVGNFVISINEFVAENNPNLLK